MAPVWIFFFFSKIPEGISHIYTVPISSKLHTCATATVQKMSILAELQNWHTLCHAYFEFDFLTVPVE